MTCKCSSESSEEMKDLNDTYEDSVSMVGRLVMIPKSKKPFTVAWLCTLESRDGMFGLPWHGGYDWWCVNENSIRNESPCLSGGCTSSSALKSCSALLDWLP